MPASRDRWDRVMTRRSASLVARIRSLVAAGVLAGLGTGCGGSSEDPALGSAAAEGRRIAADNGCAACHGADGAGGVGPGWLGLYGSTVELADGRMVTADRDYLLRSIADPEADMTAGYNLVMPPNDLTRAEAEAVVTYIEELG